MWMKEFSNFYMPEHGYILHKNVVYPTIEHFFVAMMFVDAEKRLQAANIEHPAQVKKFGRSFERRPDWHRVKRSVMMYALRQKFSDPALAALLIETGDAEIVHQVHWHDNYWASCVCPSCADKEKHNLLGKLLMIIREELNQGANFTGLALIRHKVFYGTPVKKNGTVATAG